MPWKCASAVRLREDFVLRALRACEPFSHLCRRFGISARCGYKWLKRFRLGGLAALRDASRRPHHLARQKHACWKTRLGRARRSRPHWGAKKLRAHLRRLYPRVRLPSVRTLGYWLKELGLVGARPHRARQGPQVPHPGLTVPWRLHQVWTVDFKGWVRTADGRRQEPLTVREARSRYLLEIRLLPNQSETAVRRAMTRLFKREGLPEAIRVDNGAPFGGPKAALGLSVLSVWWLRLGIRVEFTRRARPADNGAHEQMHGCYKAEVLQTPAAHRQALQRRTNRWRRDYNQRRPHEALGQKTPAQYYRPSPRPMPRQLPNPQHPKGAALCLVNAKGEIRWHHRQRLIGRAFAGQRIALLPLGKHHHAVHLGKLLIGQLHRNDQAGMRPAQWSRLPSSPIKA
jgi:transposase InsO family protein